MTHSLSLTDSLIESLAEDLRVNTNYTFTTTNRTMFFLTVQSTSSRQRGWYETLAIAHYCCGHGAIVRLQI